MAECSQEEQTRTRTVVGEDGTEKVRIGYSGSDYELLEFQIKILPILFRHIRKYKTTFKTIIVEPNH